jgi:outer membrane protein TolC
MSPPGELDASTIGSRLDALPGIRPDLLALQAGYASQEANVRAAILAQFPSIGIGVNNARDSGNIHSVGLSISLSLPLFNGNKGNIAIERATRAQLREEYNTRLASTAVDVDRLLSLQAILLQQQNDLQIYLPKLETLVTSARRAYAEGDIDALTFLNMESTWVNKRLEQINLSQVLWENRIALEALLALPGYPSQALLPAPVNRDET